MGEGTQEAFRIKEEILNVISNIVDNYLDKIANAMANVVEDAMILASLCQDCTDRLSGVREYLSESGALLAKFQQDVEKHEDNINDYIDSYQDNIDSIFGEFICLTARSFAASLLTPKLSIGYNIVVLGKEFNISIGESKVN